VEEFEQRLQTLFGVEKIFATCSGTAALDLAYALCGIKSGSEVISTPMTCSATNTPLVARGARIVWADVIPESGLIDPESVKKRITPQTKAIVACDWGGEPCDYAALKRFGVPVIQDGAHSLLSNGVSGDYRMWSFQAIKHLTTGDGGALMVPKDQEERCELLRWYGLDRRKGFSFRCKQDIPEAGYKYGMNDIAASIGLANLQHAERIVAAHRDNARYYCSKLTGLARIRVPKWNPNSSWWLYTVRVSDREGFMAHMKEEGIETSPVHDRNDIKTCMRFYSGPLPGVEIFSRSNVAIPVGWWVEKEQREKIVEAVLKWEEKLSA
jgi:dTDP-4-amino-4,6-dideoxygalactose transaminase